MSEVKKSWLERNWKWLIPVGCLSSILMLVLFVGLVMSMAFGLIKSSEPYEHALAMASEHPEVQEALGTPIKAGVMVSGNVNLSGPSGDAEFSFPISGPNGEGTVYAKAEKSAGEWSYHYLKVALPNRDEQISLLE